MLRLVQHPALVPFEAEEIVGPQVLGDKTGALLLAVDGVGGDEAAFQRRQGLEQRFEGRNLVALFFNGNLAQRQAEAVGDGGKQLQRPSGAGVSSHFLNYGRPLSRAGVSSHFLNYGRPLWATATAESPSGETVRFVKGVKRIKFFVAGNQRSIRVRGWSATKNWVELSPVYDDEYRNVPPKTPLKESNFLHNSIFCKCFFWPWGRAA